MTPEVQQHGMARPAVSVIVPSYGVAHYLPDALNSLIRQTRSDWEAIIVDDGDTEATAAAFAPFAGDPRFRLIQTANHGLAAARNAGIRVARGSRISLLDGDDLYEPRYIAKMIAALDEAPGAGFATCDAQLFGSPAFEGKRFSELEPQTGKITLGRVLDGSFKIFGACMMCALRVAEVQGFDQTLRSAEDLDMWLRLLETGAGAVYVPEALVRYRRRADSLSANSTGLADWVVRVHERAEQRLADRAEGDVARRMTVQARNKRDILHGIAAIAAGRTRDGLRLLENTDLAAQSLRWRVALRAFRLFPALATPVVRAYMRRQPFGRNLPFEERQQ